MRLLLDSAFASKRAGRPRQFDQTTVQRMSLDNIEKAYVQLLEQLGNGNRSAGLRVLCQAYLETAETMAEEMDAEVELTL